MAKTYKSRRRTKVLLDPGHDRSTCLRQGCADFQQVGNRVNLQRASYQKIGGWIKAFVHTLYLKVVVPFELVRNAGKVDNGRETRTG
jgi:hypothetical protein